MKRRFSSHVALIELTAALLMFMLASVTVLALFTTADQKSEGARLLTEAMIDARDLSARIFAADDPRQMLLETGFVLSQDEYTKEMTAGMTASVWIEIEQTAVGMLTSGRIRMLSGEETVFKMPVARYLSQEVGLP